MVQCLAEQGDINTLWLQRRVFYIAVPKFQVAQLVLFRLALAEIDNAFGVVDTNYLARIACQQFGK